MQLINQFIFAPLLKMMIKWDLKKIGARAQARGQRLPLIRRVIGPGGYDRDV